jgi:leader peptidase (prepilin peptidase)/N-methyltransferase
MVLLFIFLIGICIGSFLNVVILRAFSNESIVFPNSKCPKCQKPLKWHHNIPILSYLFLKGKCAFCAEKISIQYPIVELVTGLLFVALAVKGLIAMSGNMPVFGLSAWLNGIFILAFVSLFVVLAVTDIKEKVIFDFHAIALVILGLIYNLFNFGHLYMGDKLLTLGKLSIGIPNSLIASVLGIIAGVVIMETFARFGYLVAGTRAFGEGDSYIAAGLGAIFGWQYLLKVLLFAFIIQIVLTIPVFISKLYRKKDYKTLVSFFAFFVLVFAIKSMEYLKMFNNFTIFTVLTLLLCAVGFYACKRILGGLKDQENMTFLPFGPAMVVGALVLLFLI